MKEKLVEELLEYFISENPRYQTYAVPPSYEEKRRLLRGLINLRPPLPLDVAILKKEGDLLDLEQNEKGEVDVETLEEMEKNICLFQGDITTLKCDCIVNAGNTGGLGCFVPNHNCIDNAIHSAAGISLRLECQEILKGDSLPTGEMIACDAYHLPSKKVLTVVGPEIRNEVTKQDEIALAHCYQKALQYAVKENYRSIAFPSISTGLFSYPIQDAKWVAYRTVKEFLKDHDIRVVFDVFSKEDYDEYRQLWRSETITE